MCLGGASGKGDCAVWSLTDKFKMMVADIPHELCYHSLAEIAHHQQEQMRLAEQLRQQEERLKQFVSPASGVALVSPFQGQMPSLFGEMKQEVRICVFEGVSYCRVARLPVGGH